MEKSINAIKSLLETSISQAEQPLSDVKKVFFGDPMIIPESDMPALTIQPMGTRYNSRGNQYDEKTCTVDIRLVYNAKAYFGQSGIQNDKVFAVEDAIRKVEMMNADHETAQYTVCGTIQKNHNLPYEDGTTTRYACDLAQVTDVQYKLNTERGFPTYEVIVTVKIRIIGDR